MTFQAEVFEKFWRVDFVFQPEEACNEPKPDESINIQVNIDSDGNGKG